MQCCKEPVPEQKTGTVCLRILLTLSVLVSVLEGLDQAQSLVHRASHRQVVDGDLPQVALIVDHKQTPETRRMRSEQHKIDSPNSA